MEASFRFGMGILVIEKGLSRDQEGGVVLGLWEGRVLGRL